MQLGNFKSTNLLEWYEEANTFQCNAHGKTYTAFHNVIKEYLEEGDKYKEFGTMQGVTAACALTKKPSSVELVDINFTRFDPYRPIFKEYCKENDDAGSQIINFFALLEGIFISMVIPDIQLLNF